jgi:hypothetical protein
MKMEQTQCSETSVIKHRTPENNPKDLTRQKNGKFIVVPSLFACSKSSFNDRVTILNVAT